MTDTAVDAKAWWKKPVALYPALLAAVVTTFVAADHIGTFTGRFVWQYELDDAKAEHARALAGVQAQIAKASCTSEVSMAGLAVLFLEDKLEDIRTDLRAAEMTGRESTAAEDIAERVRLERQEQLTLDRINHHRLIAAGGCP